MKHPYSAMLPSLSEIQESILQLTVFQDLSGNYGSIIILEEEPRALLNKLQPLARYIRTHKLVLPLIVNRRFLENSLDSYPIEFINIISSDREDLIQKENLLKDLKFSAADVRLQMEREFKSKWLLTRQVILEGIHNSRRIKETMQMSISSLIPALKGFFFLKNREYPKTQKDLFTQAGLLTKIDLEIMERWMMDKSLSPLDAERYLDLLQRLMELMETYPVDV